METSAAAKKTLSTRTVIIAAAVIVLVVVGAAAAIVLNVLGREEPSSGIGYATESSVLLTQEELQAAVDRALQNAQDGNVSLLYKNNAYSTDGVNFSCYIVNSANNIYDMFLTICADLEMTDQIFLSQLIPPGSGFENIKLEHPLEVGDHRVYVAVTQVKVDEETGEESIHKQVIHTMDFHVIEE